MVKLSSRVRDKKQKVDDIKEDSVTTLDCNSFLTDTTHTKCSPSESPSIAMSARSSVKSQKKRQEKVVVDTTIPEEVTTTEKEKVSTPTNTKVHNFY